MYLTVVMALTTLSIIMTVVVLNFHYRGPSKTKPPKWFRKLLVSKLGHVLCSDAVYPRREPPPVTMRHCTGVEMGRKSRACASSSRRHLSRGLTGGEYVDMSEVRGGTLALEHSDKTDMEELANLLKVRMSSSSSSSSTRVTCSHHQEMLSILKYVVDKETKDSEMADMMNEWRQMAVIFDRILFWLFLVAIIMCSIIFLLVVPFQKKEDIYA